MSRTAKLIATVATSAALSFGSVGVIAAAPVHLDVASSTSVAAE